LQSGLTVLAEPMTKYVFSDKRRNRVPNHVRDADQDSQRKRNAFVMLVIATGILALVASKQWSRISDETVSSETQRPATVLLPSSASERTALTYIRAIQSRDFERVFEMTQWMQERIKHIRLESGPQAAQREIEAFYREERESFFSPTVGPELTEEGISDAHLFPRGAIVQVTEVREGLSRPVLNKSRPVNVLVVEVEYPPAVSAPTAANEKRIDKLRAALYLTLDGKIIKASVRGNARVYPESVLYRHLTPTETRRIRTKGVGTVERAAPVLSLESSRARPDRGKQYGQAEGRS